jgi:hypothetical protein
MVISLVGLGVVGALVFARCRDRITKPVGERGDTIGDDVGRQAV